MNDLKTHLIKNYTTCKGIYYEELKVSYQVFGKKLHSAPVVLINHALTGNSDINSNEKGWWKEIVGDNKVINTQKYTVIVFNILGNGYDGVFIENYTDFIAKDIACIFYLGIQELKITKLYSVLGGSLGGGIAWEMAALYPKYIKYLIPIASDWKSTDWVIGSNAVQESILLHSKNPIEDARKLGMLLYRNPLSFTEKFHRNKDNITGQFNVVNWLDYHGEKLKERFDVKAYLMMNHLLSTINILEGELSIEEVLQPIESYIIQIAINTDLLFVKEEILKTKDVLNNLHVKNEYYEIKSIHGHDAFLIENEQLIEILKPFFSN